MEEILEQEDYEVRIGSFNGPMDLLVYLVQKKEMSLDKIPIAEIADDFLKWVDRIGDMDLSKAGDFLYMASRLMALKVQELLPAEERDPELEEEYNADREQLMKEMLEYQRYKQVAGGLQEMEGKNFGTFSRGRLEKTQSDEDTLADANIWQLFRAYQKSLKTKISETVHHIELDYVTIQDRQQAINNFLSANGRALFEDLLDNDSHPIVAAVTFMAMLEMIKTDEIVFRQSELFGPIWIYRKKNNTEFADEMARETVFFSKDPDVKPGLVDEIRNMAIARSKAGSVGDIAAVMKEAVLWTSRGRNVSEDDLMAMLEGREDLSEVQENPFADMLKEDETASPAGTDSAASPTNEIAPASETSNATEDVAGESKTADSLHGIANPDEIAETGEIANSLNEIAETAETAAHVDAEISSVPVADATSVAADTANTAPTESAEKQSSGHRTPKNDVYVAPVFEYDADNEESDANLPDENSDDGDFTPTVVSADETVRPPEATAKNEPTIAPASQAPQQMSDEEFAEFMRKAQEFYNKDAGSTQTASKQPAISGLETDEVTPSELEAAKPADSKPAEDPVKEDKDEGPVFFGNEMTDAEYIAYLTRSAKDFGKKK